MGPPVTPVLSLGRECLPNPERRGQYNRATCVSTVQLQRLEWSFLFCFLLLVVCTSPLLSLYSPGYKQMDIADGCSTSERSPSPQGT
jgi:hypothetical protein